MNLLDSGLIVVLNTSNEAALALFNKTTITPLSNKFISVFKPLAVPINLR
jgi:hypothetical protein